MTLTNEQQSKLQGVLLVSLFACAAFYLGDFSFFKSISLSPMIIGIILGMLYANSLRNNLPDTWVPGIAFCSKRILRLGIILYGFRLTLQNIFDVGMPTIVIDAIVVSVTIGLGVMLGRLLKMDRGISLLIGVGSAICGAAAVLGAESAIKIKAYKTAVAVATVVIFGTLSMFLYPIMYKLGIVDLSTQAMGIYTGSTLHEVAHVVGAGNAMGSDIADNAIIVKMIRVTMLVPVLLILSYLVVRAARKEQGETSGTDRRKLQLPWFALFFLLVICFNSLNLLPSELVSDINTIDTFLLTIAMTALGMETSFSKFRQAGLKPFLLASMLYLWLIFGGYGMAKIADIYFL
ncbi:MAG: YeiH family putative sulfate export transporter [Succinivibrio sp.]|nr:YeiH family putative sulfate export transporter [Succinivibrio sp.]